MTKDDIFRIWAPADSVWSRFAKPVLFSFMKDIQPDASVDAPRVWEAPLDPHAAIVIDAPGEESAALGLSLAARGYRPIPLYNALMAPDEIAPVVDVVSLAIELRRGALVLNRRLLSPAAPPAFLIDANRATRLAVRSLPYFDNRSFISELDVPAAALLKEQGIERVIVVQRGNEPPADLRYVLLAWQAGGLPIFTQIPWIAWNPDPLKLKQPSPLARLFHRLGATVGYAKDPAGAFGGVVSGSG